MAGVIPEQVSSWVSDRHGAAMPPKSRLEVIARRGGWPVRIFAEGGPRPSEVVVTPLTATSAARLQVAEAFRGYTPRGPLTVDVRRVQDAIAGLEMVLRELKASISAAPIGTGEIAEFGEVAEAGHPSQPPRAKRQGKSG